MSTDVTDAQIDTRFAPFAAKMSEAGLAPVAVQTFRAYYGDLVRGTTGMIADTNIAPPDSIADADALGDDDAAAGRAAFGQTVIFKLNGGLGTSMGLDRAKSLLPVKDGLSFLDIIVRQNLSLRQTHNATIPLVFMNSFNTRADTLAALEKYPELAQQPVPLDFMQHKEPKVVQDDLSPAVWPDDPDLEWCPPGHGDIYPALVTSGMLAALLEHGYTYAFVSNADNLGAVMDERILGYFARHNLPFMMEVADRTEADKKGGHVARRTRDGRLILRESAQTTDSDMAAFQDVSRYRYFNTNSIWLNLRALADVLATNGNVVRLPLIVNKKTLDPRDSKTPKVYQLETAMGAAIEVFAGAQALRVPRSRFAPVKVCSDLLVLWSDAYALTPDSRIALQPQRQAVPPVVALDNTYYKLIHDMQARFPAGAPSLVGCDHLEVKGDVLFEGGVVVEGTARVVNSDPHQKRVASGTRITGEVAL